MAKDTTLKRSDTYQNLFSDEYMLETFGSLSPNRSTRTAHFFDLWMTWRANRMKLKKHVSISDARTQLKTQGLKEFREFQIRNGEIRFASVNDKAMAILGGIEKYTE